MGHRFFNSVVVVFWLSTMTWLIVAKVLPPLQVGEPPSYRSVYAVDRDSPPEPICWEMLWNDQPMGWALTVVQRMRTDVTEVRSFVHFDRVPIDELAPPLIRPILRRTVKPMGTLAMEANSRVEIDPLGRLARIHSTMKAVGFETEIVIDGRVYGSTLKGEVRTGRLKQEFERYLPPNALTGDELSPQARIPGLRIGQEWTVPVYSPLRFSDSRNPVEILHAKVEDRESVVIGEESNIALVVVYRSDSGSILGQGQAPRGKLWVAEDGTVLKQTSRIFGSELTFLRADSKSSERIVTIGKDRMREWDRDHRFRRPRWAPISDTREPQEKADESPAGPAAETSLNAKPDSPPEGGSP